MTYKKFNFPLPPKDVHKDQVLQWIADNHTIICGKARVGYDKDDCLKNRYSVLIPIRAINLPALQAEQPEPYKIFFPQSVIIH